MTQKLFFLIFFLHFALFFGANHLIAQNCEDQNLIQAIQQNQIKKITACLQKGSEINKSLDDDGNTLLHLAVEASNNDLVKLLLKNGAEPDITRKNGSTPLIIAANKNDWASTKHILDYGANVNYQRKKDGNTALIMASQWASEEVIKLLMENGANLNLKSPQNGIAPLLMAAFVNRPLIVQLLVERGANANIFNTAGWTALHASIQGYDYYKNDLQANEKDANILDKKLNQLLVNHTKVIDYLLGIGLDPSQKDFLDQSTLDYALQTESPASILTLIEVAKQKRSKQLNPNTPSVKSPTGHTNSVNSVLFSKDGLYYFSASSDQTIKKWDIQTQSELFTIQAFESNVTSIDLHPTSDYLLASAFQSKNNLKLFNAQNGSLIKAYAGHDNTITHVKFLNPGDRFVTASWDQTLKLWNTESGQVEETFIGHTDEVNAFDLTSDNKWMISGGRDKKVIIWNMETQEPVKILIGHQTDIRSVAISPDQKYIVSSSTTGELIVWDFNSGELVQKIKVGLWIEKIIFIPENDHLVVASGGTLNVINILATKFANNLFAHSLTINDMRWSTDGQYLISGGNDNAVNIWSRQDILGKNASFNNTSLLLEPEQDQPNSTQDLLARFITDSTIVIGKYHANGAPIQNSLALLNLKNGSIIQNFEEAQGKISNLEVHRDKGWVAASTQDILIPDLETEFEFKDTADILIWDINNPTLLQKFGGTKDKIKSLAFNKEGTQLLSVMNVEPSLSSAGYGPSKIQIWNTQSGEAIQKVASPLTGIQAARFLPNTNQICMGGTSRKLKFWDVQQGSEKQSFDGFLHPIAIANDGKKMLTGSVSLTGLSIWNLEKLQAVTLTGHNYLPSDVRFSQSGKLAVSGGNDKQILLWDIEKLQIIQRFSNPTGNIISVDLSPNEEYCLSTSTDNTLKIWAIKKGVVVLTLKTLGERDWMIQSGDYYTASRGFTKQISFAKDGKTYSYDQFDLQYNRPDLVFDNYKNFDPFLKQAYYQAYLKRLEKMGFSEKRISGKLEVPEIQVESSQSRPDTEIGELVLQVKAIGKASNIDRLNVYINDVPIYGRKGKDLSTLKTKEYEEEIVVQLSPGKNKIQVSVHNEKGIESERPTQILNFKIPKIKGDLHLITIGVSQYQDKTRNLQYAVKDAQDFMALFSNGDDNYNNIITHQLLNEAFTHSALKKLKAQLDQTKINDKVIIYIATHGLLDDQFNFFLASFKSNFSNPSKGSIPFELVEDLMNGIPARNTLLLVDACHSGEIDESYWKSVQEANTQKGNLIIRSVGDYKLVPRQVGIYNSFELMKNLFLDLRRGTGATIISSAGGVEFAYEDEKWKNGVFLYSLKQGLIDKMADFNNDGAIMLSELQKYLHEQVSELTNGLQQPISRTENLSNDWQIW